jgi:hypothetical protein
VPSRPLTWLEPVATPSDLRDSAPPTEPPEYPDGCPVPPVEVDPAVSRTWVPQFLASLTIGDRLVSLRPRGWSEELENRLHSDREFAGCRPTRPTTAPR